MAKLHGQHQYPHYKRKAEFSYCSTGKVHCWSYQHYPSKAPHGSHTSNTSCNLLTLPRPAPQVTGSKINSSPPIGYCALGRGKDLITTVSLNNLIFYSNPSQTFPHMQPAHVYLTIRCIPATCPKPGLTISHWLAQYLSNWFSCQWPPHSVLFFFFFGSVFTFALAARVSLLGHITLSLQTVHALHTAHNPVQGQNPVQSPGQISSA